MLLADLELALGCSLQSASEAPDPVLEVACSTWQQVEPECAHLGKSLRHFQVCSLSKVGLTTATTLSCLGRAAEVQ